MIIPLSDVQPGDILLHMGRGEISKLIAWAGDSHYSHAAVIYDAAQIAEAAAVGVRLMPLAGRAVDTTDFTLIDVYRPTNDGAKLQPAQLAAIDAVAKSYLGVPYPLNELVMLGVVSAIRDKVPVHPFARLIVRIAMDHYINSDPDHQVCSEYVYRCFAEAKTSPSLAPPILIKPRVDTPFPDINWIKLLEEYEEAKHRQSADPATPLIVNNLLEDKQLSVEAPETVSDEDLTSRHTIIKKRLSIGQNILLATGDRPVIDPLPNPRTILPADLAASPGFRILGALLQSV
jgi:hypothetical protein